MAGVSEHYWVLAEAMSHPVEMGRLCWQVDRNWTTAAHTMSLKYEYDVQSSSRMDVESQHEQCDWQRALDSKMRLSMGE